MIEYGIWLKLSVLMVLTSFLLIFRILDKFPAIDIKEVFTAVFVYRFGLVLMGVSILMIFSGRLARALPL